VTLTDSNFQTEVEDSTADVMLEFYAPWCGHCKALKPEYSALARDFSSDSGVKIAAMDATAHTPPAKFEVGGYPTLFWYPADTKKHVAYDGPREQAAMREWIEGHRTTKA
jgi:protein disulfide isomerase family A protein 3